MPAIMTEGVSREPSPECAVSRRSSASCPSPYAPPGWPSAWSSCPRCPGRGSRSPARFPPSGHGESACASRHTAQRKKALTYPPDSQRGVAILRDRRDRDLHLLELRRGKRDSLSGQTPPTCTLAVVQLLAELRVNDSPPPSGPSCTCRSPSAPSCTCQSPATLRERWP